MYEYQTILNYFLIDFKRINVGTMYPWIVSSFPLLNFYCQLDVQYVTWYVSPVKHEKDILTTNPSLSLWLFVAQRAQ